MVRRQVKRKMRGRGDDVSGPAGGGAPQKSSFEGMGAELGDFEDVVSGVRGNLEEGPMKFKGHKYARAAVSNPHTTNSFFACFFLFIIPLTIYSFAGKSEVVFVHELMLSLMAASMSASGLAWFILQNDDENMFVKGFIGIAGMSFLAWCYFIYKISKKTEGLDTEEDKEEEA